VLATLIPLKRLDFVLHINLLYECKIKQDSISAADAEKRKGCRVHIFQPLEQMIAVSLLLEIPKELSQ